MDIERHFWEMPKESDAFREIDDIRRLLEPHFSALNRKLQQRDG